MNQGFRSAFLCSELSRGGTPDVPPASVWQVGSSSEFFARPPRHSMRGCSMCPCLLFGGWFWWLLSPQTHLRRRDTKEWLEPSRGDKAAADFLKEIRHDEMKHRDAFKKQLSENSTRVVSEHDIRVMRREEEGPRLSESRRRRWRCISSSMNSCVSSGAS